MSRIRALVLAGLVLTLPLGSAADEAKGLHLSGSLDKLQLQSNEARGPDTGRASPLAQSQSGAAQHSLGSTQLSLPDWLKRVELGVQHGSEKSNWYIETVQPLYQSTDQTYTLFVQPRVSYRDGDGTYNLGLGYRQLFFDQQLLGGLNAFYDFAEEHTHYRAGTGVELLSRYFELRSNGYFPLSGKRRVGEDATLEVFERALRGMDVEGGGQLPYLPWAKVYAGYAYYDHTKDIDSHIVRARIELRPLRFLRIDAEAFNDNKAPWQYRIGLALTFDFGRPIGSLAPAAEPYPYKNMRHMTLHRVVREHEIKVERFAKSKTTGITVVIRRGT